MHRLPRLLCALVLGVGLLPAAELSGLAVPAAVLAAPGSCGDGSDENFIAGESGEASGTTLECTIGGNGVDDTDPPRSSGPWCASGYNTWNNPLTIDKQTGEVIVAPGTTGVSVNGVAGSPALLALYNEARRRAWTAARAAGGISSSFYWTTGLVELTAMILQIEPVTGGGGAGGGRTTQWRFHNMSGSGAYRSQYWLKTLDGASRDMSAIVPGKLTPVPIIPKLREYQLTTTPGDTTKFWVTGKAPASWVGARALAPDASASKTEIEANIFRAVGAKFAALEGGNSGGAYSIQELADLYLTPNKAWNADLLSAGALKSAYYGATVQWPSAGPLRVAFDLVYSNTDPLTGVTTGGRIAEGDAARIASLPDSAVIGISAYTPARQLLSGATTRDQLYKQLVSVVQRNLTGRKVGQMPFDDYGNVSKPENKYAFPIFHAPTPASAPSSVCTRDEFTISNISPVIAVRHPTPWVPGSFNGCRTIGVSSAATFESAITDVGACWINWRIINIPEPRFKWSDELYAFMPQVNVKQTTSTNTRISGAVYDPITIAARRNAAGEVVYRDDVGAPTVIPRSTTDKSNAVATLATYYNLTQVGVTAEVGVPGSGGFIVQGGRVARTTNKGTEYDLKLTFTQTPLERLQNADCRKLSNDTLLKTCGIGYDTVNKEWYYNVRIRTWYGGIYYAPGAEMNDPKLRGLFNPYHTVGISGYVSAIPKRIRHFAWPGDATGFNQQTGIRFPGSGDGIVSPLFGSLSSWSGADLAYLKAMVCMSDGKSDSCGNPSPDPSRPAYAYTQPGFATGAFYPLFDASGGKTGACPVASDNTACAVRVYVRSRQPILDR